MIDFGLTRKLSAFAHGKRFRVQCNACSAPSQIARDVSDLGKMLLAHEHDGRIHVTVESLKEKV